MSTAVSELYPRIRAMEAADLENVLYIERTVYEFPWTESIFEDCMKTGYVCQVFENEFEVFGYGIMSVAAGECHILNLCIGPHYQGLGLGGSLMDYLLGIAQRNKCRIAFLEVRISNRRAFELYHRLGFNEIGVRKAYYPAAGNRREDALVLAKLLAEK